MVANLPYNVGTPLVLSLLAGAPQIRRFVVMLQRESVERLAAGPGTRIYGLPSVVAQLHGSVEIAFRVAPSVFIPAPQVDSAVAVIDRHSAPVATPGAIRLAAAAFGQRRKMLRRSLAGAVDHPEDLIIRAGLEPTARAEELAPADYVRLAEALDAR
jgi:16S rRNA (adenine1518-N6/adenine1519-N6)-dimethyltransferase